MEGQDPRHKFALSTVVVCGPNRSYMRDLGENIVPFRVIVRREFCFAESGT